MPDRDKEATRRVAAAYLRSKIGGTDKDLVLWAARVLKESADNLAGVADVLELRGREEPPYEGFEAVADMFSEAQRAATGTRDAARTCLQQAAILKALSQRVRTAAGRGGVRIDRPLRTRIMRQFQRAGLTGTAKFFEKAEHGLSTALEVLAQFDIEPDGIADSHQFTQPSGRFSLDLAFTNHDDPFSPTPIVNSTLVFAFHQMESGRFEITAYVS